MTIARSPRVSVLMTVHNAAGFLRAALDSILAQSFTDWELVVVDDGSTDESGTILTSSRDPRIHVTLLPHNIGRTPALRRAFDMASGEYIAVLDADDISRADRLAKEVEYLDVHRDVLLVGSWARYIDERGFMIAAWRPPTDAIELHEFLGWANPIVHSSAMYRAAAAAEAGGYPADLPYAQDCGLWIRLAARGSLGMIPEELCDQRIVAQSMTRGRRFRVDVARDGLTLIGQARQLLSLRGLAARRNRDALMIAQVKWGLALLRSGQIFSGNVAILGALLRNPFGPLRSRAYRQRYLR